MQTLAQRLGTLQPDEVLIIVGPRMDHMLTGTKDIRISAAGGVRITYTDDTAETRRADGCLFMKPVEQLDVFSLVSFVQAGRKPSNN